MMETTEARSYPIQAERPIADAFELRAAWITVSPTAIATAALSALVAAGWSIVPPRDMAGVCPRCRNFIEPGTRHEMFNGNQMFACAIVAASVDTDQ